METRNMIIPQNKPYSPSEGYIHSATASDKRNTQGPPIAPFRLTGFEVDLGFLNDALPFLIGYWHRTLSILLAGNLDKGFCVEG